MNDIDCTPSLHRHHCYCHLQIVQGGFKELRMRSCGWQAWEVVKESRDGRQGRLATSRSSRAHENVVVQTFVSVCLSSTLSPCPYHRQLDLCLGHLRLQKSVLVVTNNLLCKASHLIRRNVSCRHG